MSELERRPNKPDKGISHIARDVLHFLCPGRKTSFHPTKGVPCRMKAQQGILEYVMLTLFVVIVIIALLFFLSWWQASQLGLEKRSNAVQRTYSVLGQFINDPVLVKSSSVLDDSKLTALQSMDCDDMEKVFGSGWYANVTLFEGDARMECKTNYPNCNYWEFCPRNYGSRCSRISYAIPVNIYRKMKESTGVGILEVGSCQ